MPRKPPETCATHPLHNRPASEGAPAANAAAIPSAPPDSTAESPSQSNPKVRNITIIAGDPVTILVPDPEPFLVSAETPEELVQTTFALLVARIGEKRARDIWNKLPKRRRGRPANSVEFKDALLVPLLMKFEREMPGCSVTKVATAVVRHLNAGGTRWARRNTQESAAIKRLVRHLSFRRKFGHFSWFSRQNKGRI
jgi:hypothetical protein